MDYQYRDLRTAAEEELLARASNFREALAPFQIPSNMMSVYQNMPSQPVERSSRITAHHGISWIESQDVVTCEDSCDDSGILKAIRRTVEFSTGGVSNTILTPGLFPMMELPPEIRVEILRHLLISSEENITIDSTDEGAQIMRERPKAEHEYPSIAILQTCRRINEEGTPILYGQNIFTICLPLEHKHSPRQSSAFFLRPMRWSTIACINTMNFISSNTPALPHDTRSDHDMYHRPRAFFTCTAAHLLSRFTISDFKYSPKGPDDYVVLSMSNYVSTQVMRAELSAFQKELEMMMRPSEDYLAAMVDDPAT